MSVRICHICSGHQADDGRVFGRMCVTLAKVGYDVHLIARSKGSGTFTEHGVTVHPLPDCKTSLQRIARRCRVADVAAKLEPSIYHVHEPELLGPVIKIAGSRQVIYDVHESYLDVLMDREWIPRLLRPLMRAYWDIHERKLLRGCSAVVAVTDNVSKRYFKLHPRVKVIGNFPELDEFRPRPYEERDGRTCVFTGTLDANRGLFQAISAIGMLNRRGLRVNLIIAGKASNDFIKRMMTHARDENVGEYVIYKGSLPRKEAILLASTAAIGLIPHLPYGNNMAAWPVKMMEYMALGLPIIYSDFPSHRVIAGSYNAGIAVNPYKPSEIAAGIEKIICDPKIAGTMGLAGQAAVMEELNWGREKMKLIELYDEVLQSQKF